jgi:sulfur-oxidizing protein SoxY
LQAPARAIDAAFVPVTVHTGAVAIRRLTLVVDNNPSPVAAVIDFGPRAFRAEIETRLRLDDYSMVRAIAELADGALLMSARYVKAAGGCSAPAGADAAAAAAALGRMQLRTEPAAAGTPIAAQWQVSHPNHTGLAMDQATRHYTPAHFVRVLDISFDGERVLHADLDFALSENPVLRFQFTAPRAGTLRADAEDTEGRRFSTSLAVAPA